MKQEYKIKEVFNENAKTIQDKMLLHYSDLMQILDSKTEIKLKKR